LPHDAEEPRIDDRHFRPAWRVLTQLDGLLADKAITAAERHAAADYRELVDQVRFRAFTRASAFGTVRAAGKVHFGIGAPAISMRRPGSAGSAPSSVPGPARCSRRRWCGICHGHRGALSLRSENRARLGDRRNQGASYRLKDGDRNGEGPQTGW
jgi:hypothetical protein